MDITILLCSGLMGGCLIPMGCSGLKSARACIRCMTDELWSAIDILHGLLHTTRGRNRASAQMAFDNIAFAARLGLAKHSFILVDDSSLDAILNCILPLAWVKTDYPFDPPSYPMNKNICFKTFDVFPFNKYSCVVSFLNGLD